MSKQRIVHRISDVRPVHRIATCAECGPVRVNRSGSLWRCAREVVNPSHFIDGMMTCSVCDEPKSPDRFGERQAKGGELRFRRLRCDTCTALAWKQADADPRRKRMSRNGHLQRGFSITLEQYEEMYERQGGVCAICRKPEIPGRSLAVDHDRKCCPGDKSCGKCIRGLLCFRHNTGLGKIEEHIDQVCEYLNADYVVLS